MEQKLVEDVAYIKAKIENITELLKDQKATLCEHVKEQEGVISDIKKQLTLHEIALGKIGLAFTLLIFIATAIFNFAIGWIKDIIK